MKKIKIALFAFALSLGLNVPFLNNGQCAGLRLRPPFPNAHDRKTKDHKGPVFELSQNYPDSVVAEDYPWKKYNYKTQWRQYMNAVIEYCAEGNIGAADLENDWRVQDNKIKNRSWYHAPWLHWGPSGRDFVHGMTSERMSRPGELSNSQKTQFQNWAVSFYNQPGGYTIGRVWKDPMKPDPAVAQFPEGTVSIKLLFTEATEKEVPYLKGSPEWSAYIYEQAASPPLESNPRTIKKLRLLQVDVAVKDKNADDFTGWVFGTFAYNSAIKARSPWLCLQPVGIMWGNDPQLTRAKFYIGDRIKEGIINDSPELTPQHLGYAGRLNGPVDNPLSSCLSCHSTAQWPPDMMAPIMPPKSKKIWNSELEKYEEHMIEYDSSDWMHWFRNVPKDQAFTNSQPHKSLDYSMQLSVGIQNFYQWKAIAANKGGAFNDASGLTKADEEKTGSLGNQYNRTGEIIPLHQNDEN